MISGIAHINLTVPPDTLDAAGVFYGTTLGLTPRPVPHLQRSSLAWFDIIPSSTSSSPSTEADLSVVPSPPQQVHIAFSPAPNEASARRHPCFKLESKEKLIELQGRIWDHFKKGGLGAPVEADEPGRENSGSKGVEYPDRFFCRDYANNRLEFSL